MMQLFVSDGIHNSQQVLLLVTIEPTNDEPPILICSNVTSCMEGSMTSLAIEVADLDVPHDDVMVVVSKKPKHGMLMNEMDHIKRKRSSRHNNNRRQHHNDVTMGEFSMREIINNDVIPAYMHDGSENFIDEIELKISDGKFEQREKMMIKVVKVNDEKPELITNEALTVEFGEDKVISNLHLHAIDRDSELDNLKYVLTVAPRRGSVLVLRKR